MTPVLYPTARPTRPPVSRWYYAAGAYFILQGIFVFNFIDSILFGDWSEKTSGDPLVQGLNLLQIGVCTFLFWGGYRRTKQIGAGGKLLLALAAFFFISLLWSVVPDVTLRRVIIYIFSVLGMIGLGNLLTADQLMDLFRRSLFFCAIASLVALVVWPSLGFMTDGTARGVVAHKNILGEVMAGGVLVSLHGYRAGGARAKRCLMMIPVFVAVCFLSRSGTSLVTTFLFIGADRLIALYRRGGAARATALAIAIPALVLVLLSPGDMMTNVLGALGKDATLTGRTTIWAYAENFIAERPILGWGYAAFWSPLNPLARTIDLDLGFLIPHAHNGLLEALIEGGVVGTSLVLLMFIRNIRIAVRCLRTPWWNLGHTILLCSAGLIQYGLTEAVLLDTAQILVPIFFILGLIGERELRAAAVPQRFRPVARPFRSEFARTQRGF